MQFYGDVSILFEGRVLKEETLETYRNKWKGAGPHYPEMGSFHQHYDNEEIICALMERSVPFLIFCKEGTRLILDVQFEKFVDGQHPQLCDFGLRMIPREGNIM